MQLELFGHIASEPPMRMVLDTRDFSALGTPDEVMATIAAAKASLPPGACDAFIELRGGTQDLHQVCRLRFRRPMTPEEAGIHTRYG